MCKLSALTLKRRAHHRDPYNVAMIEVTDPVVDALLRWEEAWSAGKDLSAEEVCPDQPTLWEELRRRIERRKRLSPFLESRSSTPVDLWPRIAGFEIQEIVGQGGMGVVYKARQQQPARLVALKMITAEALSSDRARLRTEANAVARLEHPNIINIFEVGEHEGRPFLVLELVEGDNLAGFMHGAPLAAETAATLTAMLAQAVHHAHVQGIVHRDLKPANVLMTRAGVPKIADFGLAKCLDDDAGRTRTGHVLGTPCYMAPEQALGQVRDISPATDVYALGVILYEMLTGHVPFVGESVLETLEQVRSNDPVPPRQLKPKMPKDLETICLKCLEKDPKRRYASAQALAEDLHAFLRGDPIKARPDNFVDQIVRAVSRIDANVAAARHLSRLYLSVAPVPAVAHALLVFGFWHRPDYAQIVFPLSILCVFIVQSILLVGARPALELFPARLRRHTLVLFSALTIASILAPFIVWWNCPADRFDLILLTYPFLMVVVAVFFFSLASDAGFFFIVGGAAFVTAVVMALYLPLAPLLAGFFITCNVGGQGLFFRWVLSQSEAAPAQCGNPPMAPGTATKPADGTTP
jgi:serine/threonine protein kinase